MLSDPKFHFSANYSVDALHRYYSALETSIRVNEQSTKTTYRSPVNFIESMQKPRHRWFPYKEGFSPSFVEDFLSDDLRRSKGLVFDPFSGSGTTGLVASNLGLPALGFDVSPLTTFIAATKAIVINADELRTLESYIKKFEASALEEQAADSENATVNRYFRPNVLTSLLRVKAFFQDISCPKSAALFKLAFLCAVEPFSTHRKAGNGVKLKTKHTVSTAEDNSIEAVKQFVSDKLLMFVNDIRDTDGFRAPSFHQRSCLGDSLPTEVQDVGAVLTSPPYANCFDYSKIYMSELWLGDFFKSKLDQKSFRDASVRSHVHATWADRYNELGLPVVNDLIRPLIEEQNLWSSKIGTMLSGYFADLGKLLYSLKPRLRSQARLGFVVGNSFYGGVTVATDLLLADLARTLGYELEEIRVYRGIIPSSQQFRKLGSDRKYMRESMVVLRRP